MILTTLEQMNHYKKGSVLYIAPTPKVEIQDTMFNFNLSAKLSVYYPISEIEQLADGFIGFEPKETDKKTSYVFEMDDIYRDLRGYDKYHTHDYIIGDDEREVIIAWRNSIYSFIETVKRTNTMLERFKGDFDNAPFIIENQKNFPEDWV